MALGESFVSMIGRFGPYLRYASLLAGPTYLVLDCLSSFIAFLIAFARLEFIIHPIILVLYVLKQVYVLLIRRPISEGQIKSPVTASPYYFA